MPLKVAIHGAAGRMGQRLIALGHDDPQVTLVGAIENRDHPQWGDDAGEVAHIGTIDIPIASGLADDAEVVIDFSIPVAAAAITGVCAESRIPVVVATTGFDQTQQAMVEQAAQVIPIVWAPSMSPAVNVAMKLTQIAARSLRSEAAGVDVEIIERHHRFKEDAPSGTALRFGALAAEGLEQTSATHGREGRPGPRPRDEIGYHAVRSGDNPGEHTIVFGMLGETLEITVKATHRDCYALGALAAAKFVVAKPPGLYSMFDVLGLGD